MKATIKFKVYAYGKMRIHYFEFRNKKQAFKWFNDESLAEKVYYCYLPVYFVLFWKYQVNILWKRN